MFYAEGLHALVTKRTKAIFVTNPNNPTGTIIGARGLKTIAEYAGDVGAYVVCDEVYRGLEHMGPTSPYILDYYDKCLVTSSMSKPYGLPGLRVGWVAGPREDVERAWAVKDYTSISPSIPSQVLALKALEARHRLIRRARQIVNSNMKLASSILGRSELFRWRITQAAPFVFLRTKFTDNTLDYCEYVFRNAGILICPGECFETPGYVVLAWGAPTIPGSKTPLGNWWTQQSSTWRTLKPTVE